jgi:putative addiction module component (TIGR02574 family)
MAETIESLVREATELPPDQRFTLARRILASVEPEGSPAIDAAWEAAIRERIGRYDAGLSKSIPASEVFAELDRRLAS